MTKLSIADSYTPVEVDLWGHDFHSKPATRSTSKVLQEAMAEFEKLTDKDDASDEDLDRAIVAIADVLDLLLTPADGKRTKASVLVMRKWQNDELSVNQLVAFFTNLAEAGRPT